MALGKARTHELGARRARGRTILALRSLLFFRSSFSPLLVVLGNSLPTFLANLGSPLFGVDAKECTSRECLSEPANHYARPQHYQQITEQ
jgi:hypothetical protein